MKGLIPRILRGDERALLYVIGGRHPGLDRAMHAWTHLGDAVTTIGASLVMIASGSPVWRRAGFVAAATLACSHLAVQLLKRTIARTRPLLPSGLSALIEPPDHFSFPSGHAAAALSVALGAALALPTFAPWLIGAALIAGLTRCYLGVHYPGDVVAGWLLAVTAFLAAVHI